jgi:hypothetical protein
MKNCLFFGMLILGITTFSAACCDDDDLGYCSEKAIILEVDYRECACCGGWFIQIGEDTLRAIDLPTDFQLSLQVDEYPLPVYLEWSPMEDPCLGDEIDVECIRRRE